MSVTLCRVGLYTAYSYVSFDQLSTLQFLNSILGPLLFLIYINDLPELCDAEGPNSEIYLYADDLKLIIRDNHAQEKLQSVMNLIKTWSDAWLLRLNIDKCKSVS